MAMKGINAHIDRLRKLSGPHGTALIGKALFAGGEAIQVEAQISITTGAVSGKGHVASLPGQPPNADTHVLADNIETTQEAELVVRVSSNARYASALEFGTSKIAERPYMRPARDKMRGHVKDLVEAALAKAVRQSRSTKKD